MTTEILHGLSSSLPKEMLGYCLTRSLDHFLQLLNHSLHSIIFDINSSNSTINNMVRNKETEMSIINRRSFGIIKPIKIIFVIHTKCKV
jgi:hypothetical protein